MSDTYIVGREHLHEDRGGRLFGQFARVTELVDDQVMRVGRIIPAHEVAPYDEVLEPHGWKCVLRTDEFDTGMVLFYDEGLRYLHADAPVRVR